jgi:hypothetical protein
MRKLFKFNTWEYEIIKAEGQGIKGYGYNVYIYKNDIKVYSQGGFGVESIAESYITKYIIEHEFNIELNDYIED